MGICHGWEIDSDLSFVYLRKGSGPRLRIVERDSDPDPRQPGTQLAEIRRRNETLTRVFRDEETGQYNVWMEGVGWFNVDPTRPTISIPSFPHPEWLEGMLWGLPTSLILLDQGEIQFHASAVEIDGTALLMAAPGGHGKTTLAAALMKAGHRLLSEDLIRCSMNQSPLAFPGPAMIRLRHDVARHLSIPGTFKVTEDPEKLHLAIDPELRGSGDPIPIRGLVFLHRGDEILLERVAGLDVIPDIWAVTLNLPTSSGRAKCFAQVTELAEVLPIWRVTRPVTWEALPDTVDLLRKETAPT